MLVPGGVTLPPARGEDAGTIQTLGARYAHGLISLEDAASLGCAACASSGGGCQFLGTAATAQVVGEALGLAVGHTALAPSGEPVWLEGGLRAVAALPAAVQRGQTTADVLSDDAIHNAMVVHAAFGGSTNLLLHVPAIAHAAGLRRPDRGRLARGGPLHPADRLGAAQRTRPAPDRTGVPGRRGARGDAAPARSRAAPDGRAGGRGHHAGRAAGRLAGQRAAAAVPADPGRAGLRPRRGDLRAGPGPGGGHGGHRGLPGRQPGPGGVGGQGDRDRSPVAGRRRGLPVHRPGPGVHRRAHGDRGHQDRRGAGR